MWQFEQPSSNLGLKNVLGKIRNISVKQEHLGKVPTIWSSGGDAGQLDLGDAPEGSKNGRRNSGRK